jgi:hypothetical protein
LALYLFIGFYQGLVDCDHGVEILEKPLSFIKYEYYGKDQSQKIYFSIMVLSDSLEVPDKDIEKNY